MTDWFFFGWLAWVAVAYVVLVRNNITHSVRCHFLLSTTGERWVYDQLPDYFAMLLHPKYMGLWTKDDWRTFAAIQEAKEGV